MRTRPKTPRVRQNSNGSDLNRNAKVVGEIARLCYLITNETNYDAHFEYAAHVDNIVVRVYPEGNFTGETTLEFTEYLNSKPDSLWRGDNLGSGTRPAFLEFKRKLTVFLEKARDQ